jgi:hypothetical protein
MERFGSQGHHRNESPSTGTREPRLGETANLPNPKDAGHYTVVYATLERAVE